MRKKARNSRRMTVKRLLRKIVFFFIVLNWLIEFLLKAIKLIEKLFG